ncbi:MAG: DoxX family protein [Fimbriimonadaceae bacterium]
MAKTKNFLQSADLGLLFLRIGVGGLMLMHGIAKLTNGIDGIKTMTVNAGLPEFYAYGVYVGEVLAPIMVLLGVGTRIGALLIAFTMINAIWLVGIHQVWTLTSTGGPEAELALLFLAGSLALVFTGSGKYGILKGRGWTD